MATAVESHMALVPLPTVQAQGTQAFVGAQDAESLYKRARSVVLRAAGQVSPDLGTVVKRLREGVACMDRSQVKEALGQICAATRLLQDNHQANQRAFLSLKGASLLAQLVQAKAIQDADCTLLALMTLENLSCSREVHAYLLNKEALLQAVVSHMGNTCVPLALTAARVLANCAYIEPRFQTVIALAGADKAAIQMLAQADKKCVRQGAWLLCNLSMNHGAPARATLRDAPAALKGMVQLLSSDDEVCADKAAQTLGHVAREGGTYHAALLAAGTLPALAAQLDPSLSRTPEVKAAVLSALSALVVADVAAAQALVGCKAFLPGLQAILSESTLVTSDFAVSRALVSTHLLLLVLGRMYFKHGLPTPAPLQVKGTAAAGCSSPPPSSAVLAALMSQLTMDADDAGELRTGIKEAISAQLQEAHYITLRVACSMFGLTLPPYNPAMWIKGEGIDTVPAVMAAMLQHELLPFLSDDSARDKVHAIARVHQMAVCLSPVPACRAMFAEAGLLGALKRLLDPSEASMVRAAALACLDALLGFTEVCLPLASVGQLAVLDEVLALSAEANRDELLRVLADHTLVSLYLASEHLPAAGGSAVSMARA